MFNEENERVNILSSLDSVHGELKGEHEEDLKNGKALEGRQKEIKEKLAEWKAEIENQKKDLSSRIKELEGTI